MPARAPGPPPPPTEFDDYVIVRRLGTGAMGEVYLADDTVLARPVAIKFIAGVDPDLETRQRFLLEARAAARIQHPNVVSVYRVGEIGERPYLVTELVRGRLLAELPRPMAAPAALAIAVDLARGLAAAHRRGVVHCDVKPSNAMVGDDGVAKLVDFGLARVVQDGCEDATATMVGTPDYLAPELWAGEPASRRADVYALGVLIYELLVGATPFAEVAPAQLGATVRARDAAAVPGEPRLAAVVARCLARDPEQRYPSGEELRVALERLGSVRADLAPLDHNPYSGLRAFEAAQRGLFFGREPEVSAIVERLRTDAVVVVTGDSGVGKSSLCRAGALPAILEGALGGGRTWSAFTMVPGRHPLASLAAALDDPDLAARVLADPEVLVRELHRRAAGGGLVLFVDQLEELVTVGAPDEVAAFDAALARLSEGAGAVRLVATVRADFLTRLAALPRFGQELARVLYFVRPLPPERLRDVIVGPATATAIGFESEAMIDELVATTADAGSGGLPLLSFALAELWEARDRDRRLITAAALAAMGGVAGALARHADAVVAQMPPLQRVHARKALLRLITADGTRVRRTEAELAVSEHTRAALAVLVAGRLLVVHDRDGGATFELAHEVLVGGWGTLRGWLDADADDRARREQLAAAAGEWQRVGRRGDLLWRGPRLIEAHALEVDQLTDLERTFVAASARAARQRRWAVRIAVVGVVVLVALVYGIQRHLTAARLAAAVDAELARARVDLDLARDHQRRAQARADEAFARFDRGADDAEPRWQTTLEERAAAERKYRAAAQQVEAALAKDPTRADVRALLGDVLLERAALADVAHDTNLRDELLGRLPSYDRGGARRARWLRPGRLIVHAAPGASITVDRAAIATGATGAADVPLAPGGHLVSVTTPGRPPIVEPIAITRDATLELRLIPPAAVLPGFVYVAPGWFKYGTADDETLRRGFLTAAPIHPRTTDGFQIARTEVTFADWLAYVDAQPAPARAALLPNVAAKIGGGIVVEATATGYRLTVQAAQHSASAAAGEPLRYAGRARRTNQNWARLPVTGITALEAEAYVGWLDRSGRVPGARLCSEVEWERAARGADGRATPTGRTLEPDDANFDLTYDRDFMGPDEVGAHPTSVSPYGLQDTAGNAFEWTTGARGGTYVLRGGSYYHDRKTADLANRNESAPSLRDATAGVRICASVDPK